MAPKSAKPTMATDKPSKVIFFDLDDTLFDRRHCLECGLSAFQKKCPALQGIEKGRLVEAYHTAVRETRKKNGGMDDVDFKIRRFFAQMGLEDPSNEDVEAFSTTRHAASRTNRRATPGAIDTLIRLRENGYRIGVITNGSNKEQLGKVRDIGLVDLVEHVVTSSTAKCAKPGVAIFQNAIELFDAVPKDTYMVGDSYVNDVLGSRRVGMKPIWFNPPRFAGEDRFKSREEDLLEIQDLDSVLDILGIEP